LLPVVETIALHALRFELFSINILISVTFEGSSWSCLYH